MKLLEKYVWCDGTLTKLAPEKLTAEEDPTRLGRGQDRIDILDLEKQEIFGFGGAFTEASAVNYMKLSPDGKRRALEMLFGAEGLRYDFCRVCIHSSDFSEEEYIYTEEGDFTLSTFSIDRDRKAVIPFIKDALAAAPGGITLFASPWSPPGYMKTSNSMKGGRLLPECYRLWAEYILRFIEEYEKEGIIISAVTAQNEPGSHRWESCEWTDGELIEFTRVLSEVLSGYSRKIRIICWDYNRGGMFEHASKVYRELGDRVWGAGFHWYNGVHTGELEAMHAAFPDRVLIETEFCHGISARMYGKYRSEIMTVLGSHTNAVVEWNLLLDEEGGPYHSRDIGCCSPLYRTDSDVAPRGTYLQSFIFSHFIKPGARVLYTSSAFKSLMTLAVRNPDGRLLIYTYNESVRDEKVTYCFGSYRWSAESVAGNLTLYIAEP